MARDRMTIQQVMRRIGGQEIFERLVAEIQRVAWETGETGGKGKVTFTVETSKPKGSTLDDPMIQFKTQLVPKLPAAPARVTHLYVGEEGLSTDDPRQVPMELRAVETSATVRQTEADTTVREA